MNCSTYQSQTSRQQRTPRAPRSFQLRLWTISRQAPPLTIPSKRSSITQDLQSAAGQQILLSISSRNEPSATFNRSGRPGHRPDTYEHGIHAMTVNAKLAPSEPMVEEATGPSEFRAAWKPLLACGLSWGMGPLLFVNVNGIFVEPISTATGLPATAVQIGTITTLAAALCSPIAVIFWRKWPVHIVSVIGLIGVMIATTALVVFPPSVGLFLTVAIVIGVVGSLTFQVPFANVLASWYHKNFGLAIGLQTSMAGLIYIVLTPILVTIIYTYGWQAGYIGFIVAMLVFGVIPALWGLRVRPGVDAGTPIAAGAENSRPEVRVGLREMANLRAWLVILACAFGMIGIAGFISNMQPILLSKGADVTLATTTTTMMTAGYVVGYSLYGFLIDRLPSFIVPILSGVPAVIAAVLLAVGTTSWWAPLFPIFSFVIGLGTGAEGLFLPFFIRKFAGDVQFPRFLSFGLIVIAIAALVGGIGFSAIADLQGSYALACIIGAIGFLLMTTIIPLVELIRPRRRADGMRITTL